MARSIIVIPNHLPHLDFLLEWDALSNHEIIVIQDIGKKPKIPLRFSNVTIYDHKDIEADLGKNAWIIPTGTSACRSYGYYKAWQRGADYVLTLDNDCYPDRHAGYWLEGHEHNLEKVTTLDWWPSTVEFPFTRGLPYRPRNTSHVYLSHGLWSGVPDLDAPTSLHNPLLRLHPANGSDLIPRHNFFPMCGMNLAWRSSLTPAMYFGIFGGAYGFDQYDDIWAGVLVKKVMDHLGHAAMSGYPSVEHRKQSDVFTNLKKQAPGMEMNENFWQAVRDIKLESLTITGSYIELITKLPDTIIGEPKGWTKQFKKAALIWAGLFS